MRTDEQIGQILFEMATTIIFKVLRDEKKEIETNLNEICKKYKITFEESKKLNLTKRAIELADNMKNLLK